MKGPWNAGATLANDSRWKAERDEGPVGFVDHPSAYFDPRDRSLGCSGHSRVGAWRR